MEGNIEKRRRMPEWAIVVIALVIVVAARGAYSIARNWQDAGPRSGADGSAATANGETSDYAEPVVTGRIDDVRITEASGLVASRSIPGVLWTHNDSGGEPVVFCVRLPGDSCGTITLTGVEAEDWEDIAIAPGVPGDWNLYIADIGDNRRQRSAVLVHRIPEPSSVGADTTVAPETTVLSYPDRPHDAETLLVHPDTGDLYVITKEFSSRSLVYKAEAPLDGEMTLERVGIITINDFLSDRTGGDISPDGMRVILSTYGAGYELVLPAGAAFDEIWEQEPQRVDIGEHQQGEAVTYGPDGDSVFATSEGAHPPLYRIDRKRD